jgi:hypothetical protein
VSEFDIRSTCIDSGHIARKTPLTLRGRSDRLEVLHAIKAADLKVLRLFISETFENFKNTGSVYMPDIEPKQVGQFDDTQLAAIDQLMVEAHERGKFNTFLQSQSDANLPTW